MSTPCDDGWIEDETACSDPDHCSSHYACRCNPEYDHEHECRQACHPRTLADTGPVTLSHDPEVVGLVAAPVEHHR